MKNNENTKLNKYIVDMRKRNGDYEDNEDNKNKNSSKGRKTSEEGNKYNIKGQKRLYKLKKQNNINFEYDMDK